MKTIKSITRADMADIALGDFEIRSGQQSTQQLEIQTN